MPPRYAYWTILVDEQPTAFRAALQEDLLPTLKRLQLKNPSAKMMWFQNGKLWPSRIDAQEFMRARGEMGRRGDERQAGYRDRERKPFGDRERTPFRERSDGGKRSAWTPRGEPSTPPPTRNADDKLEWKPKGEFVPAPKRAERPERDEWKPKKSFDRERKPFRSEKPEWKPKGSFDRERTSRPPGGKPEWKPKGSFDRERKPFRSEKPDWKPKASFSRDRRTESRPQDLKTSRPSAKLEWKPKGEGSEAPQKRKWVPKEEYKKSQGIEARRDKNWRPGGEHKDPRQKYKDAKKAKWSRFKQNIRTRWESKKKKDE